jgi:hypothetical protein
MAFCQCTEVQEVLAEAGWGAVGGIRAVQLACAVAADRGGAQAVSAATLTKGTKQHTQRHEHRMLHAQQQQPSAERLASM